MLLMLLSDAAPRGRLGGTAPRTRRRLARMPTPEPDVPAQRRRADLAASRYDLFLSVAGDLDRVGTAYDAELVVSTMLGAAYGIAGSDRAAVLTETAEGLRRHLARRRTRHAALL